MGVETVIRRIFLLVLVAGACSHSTAASSGSESAGFLDIPVGAGPAALGSAYSALATDAYAPVYNPAGLGFLPVSQMAAQHLDYLQSIHYEFLSGVYRLRDGLGLGVAAQYLGSGDITGRGITGDLQGSYNVNYGAYTFAYGQQIQPSIAVGVAGKIIHGTIDAVGSTAYAGDFGGLWKARDNFRVSGVLTNVGTPLTFINEGSSLPLSFHLGAAYQPQRVWVLSGEMVVPKSGSTAAHVGIEWNPVTLISFRTGYRTDTTKNLGVLAGFGTGIGLHLWGQEFSYAWTPYGDLGDAQYFSLVVHFGEDGTLKHNLDRAQRNYGRDYGYLDGSSDADPVMLLLSSDESHTAASPAAPEKKL